MEGTPRSPRLRALGWAASFTLLAAPAALYPQISPDEQARRLLDDGRLARSQGKVKQALDNFNTIVTGFPNTASVDDALLEIGRYHVEVEGDVSKGREAFEQVAQRFPQSDGAPGAYYYLGWIALTRASTNAEIDDALAQFTRIPRLYPRSAWVPKALHAAGLGHRKAGRFADAVESQRRVALEYPSNEVTPAAQFQIGECLSLIGEARQAMEEYQQVRNSFPDSEWSTRALDRITALYRLHGSGKPSFSLDASYSVGAGDLLKEVRAMLMTPARSLWIASAKAKSVSFFDGSGKLGPGVTAEEPVSLSVSPGGDLVVAAKTAVRIGSKDIKTFSIPSDKPGVPEPLERILAAVVAPGGGFLVADEKRKRIYRYDREGQYQGTFPDAKERDVSRLILDGEGGIVALDREEKAVRVFDESGRLLRTLGPRGTGFDLRKPVDVAVDPFRNTYVLDEEGGLFIFASHGQLLGKVGGEELRRPKALTIAPDGAILVYDDKAERVLRYK